MSKSSATTTNTHTYQLQAGRGGGGATHSSEVRQIALVPCSLRLLCQPVTKSQHPRMAIPVPLLDLSGNPARSSWRTTAGHDSQQARFQLSAGERGRALRGCARTTIPPSQRTASLRAESCTSFGGGLLPLRSMLTSGCATQSTYLVPTTLEKSCSMARSKKAWKL